MSQKLLQAEAKQSNFLACIWPRSLKTCHATSSRFQCVRSILHDDGNPLTKAWIPGLSIMLRSISSQSGLTLVHVWLRESSVQAISDRLCCSAARQGAVCDPFLQQAAEVCRRLTTAADGGPQHTEAQHETQA